MPEPLRLTVEDGHLVHTSYYDEDLNFVAGIVIGTPGYQLNGHRAGCRCETCRPDIMRLPDPGEKPC